MSNGDRITVSD